MANKRVVARSLIEVHPKVDRERVGAKVPGGIIGYVDKLSCAIKVERLLNFTRAERCAVHQHAVAATNYIVRISVAWPPTN